MKLGILAAAVAGVALSASQSRFGWDRSLQRGAGQTRRRHLQPECSTCHGERLQGGEGAPALNGSDFASSWNGQTVGDLFDRIRQTMPAPPEQPGKLTPQQNADVVAHILRRQRLSGGHGRTSDRCRAAEANPDRSLQAVGAHAASRVEVVSIGLAWLVAAAAASAAPVAPTFNRDVAPIFYARCVSCHRPGEVAPMALVTYADARPWARAIKTKVASREMPPWFADPKFSRALANDHSLTQAEIDTIVAWVDSGAAQGTGSPPPPPPFTEGLAQLQEPSAGRHPRDARRLRSPGGRVAAGLHRLVAESVLRGSSSSRPSSCVPAPSARSIIPT